MTAFILVFFCLNIFTTSQLKKRGIDNLVEHSINNIFTSIENRLTYSVRQYLLFENEKILYLIQSFAALSEQGVLTDEEARIKSLQVISSVKIGNSGYPYVISNDGIMLQHPVESYIGEDYSSGSNFHKQLLMEKGYLEYEHENPGEANERRKILYMDRYQPWNWIINTTAYEDDPAISIIRLEEVQSFIRMENHKPLECISILNKSAGYLVPPQNNIFTECNLSEVLNLRFDELKEQDSGRLILPLRQNDSKNILAVVFYKYIPKLDWMIISAGALKTIYAPVITTYIIQIATIIISLFLLVFLNRVLSDHLTAPLKTLVGILDQNSGEHIVQKADIKTGDEFESLGVYFNRFLDDTKEAQKSIKILAKFPDENPNPVLRISNDGVIEYANRHAVEEILAPNGLGTDQKIPDALLGLITAINSLTGRNEYSIGEKTFSFLKTVISEEEGSYLFGTDITRHKKYESLQLLSENIFQNSIEGMVITDADGNIESVNPAFTQITEYTEEEVLGENPRILKSHRHGVEFYKSMWTQLLEKGYWEGEIWNQKKSGKVYPEFLTITSMRNEEGELERFISFFHDLSDVKEKEDKIIYEATHDQLTGLPNRVFLINSLSDLIVEAEKTSITAAVVYIDIINLKRINESAGPEYGDRLIIEVANRIKQAVKSPDLIVRVGGDEFVCVFRKTDKSNVSEKIINISQKILMPFIIREREINIAVSFGVSFYPEDDHDPLLLVSKAEAAMTASRKDVNSHFAFYSPGFKKDGLSRLEIETGLKKAFETQQFYLNYQPKVSVKTGRIAGAEALLRLKPIENQFVGPDVFIPIAEEMGLIEPLGAWVLKQACNDALSIIKNGHHDFNVAVNLSPRQFRKAELPEMVRNIIDEVKIPSENLNLEITESMAIDNVEQSIKMMNQLTEIGLALSIDDFGTGFSSLSYLSQFPVNILKIDKAFVVGIPDDPKKTGIVQAILSLAENLGMETVAEGVETEKHFRFLKERGCQQIQGYYFYKPMLIEDLIRTIG